MIKELGEAGFNYVFEGSDLVAKATEGIRGGIDRDFGFLVSCVRIGDDFSMRRKYQVQCKRSKVNS